MDIKGAWIAAGEFADWAGMSPQAARKALRGATTGKVWRGQTLQVRRVFGRGGKSGLRYEVSLSSLSEALGDELSGFSELPDSDDAPWRPTAKDQGAVIGKRWAVIKAAVEPGANRAAAVESASKASGQSVRTIRRWIAAYDRHGLNGLARRRPSNAGKARIHVSREFDGACRKAGYPDDLVAKIGDHIDERLMEIWASRAEAGGAAQVGYFAEHALWKACKAHGVDVPEASMRMSRRHVERFVMLRQGNLYRNNRKAFEDGKPRITRDWTALEPMDWIVADVKHLDVMVTRADGSEAWPKIVGLQDAGTGRLFVYPLLLERGEGVRREHVIEAFIAMVSDPAWGFPKRLYLDNGSEFSCFEKIRPALALVGEHMGREIIYAKPYNASAKMVENGFRRLDKYLINLLPGYVGGERMNKKTQNVGKAPKPYPHSWETFCKTLEEFLIAFNDRSFKRQDGDASPTDRFRTWAQAGWKPTRADPGVLDATFCDRETRRIDRGVLKIGARRYHNEDLHALPNRTEVAVARPWRRDAEPLFLRPDGIWSQLEYDAPYPAESKDGAREAGRRQRRHEIAARDRAKLGDKFNPVAATLEIADRHRPVELTGRPDRLGGSSELLALADGRAAGAARQVAKQSEAERLRLREEARTAQLERDYAKLMEKQRAG